MMLLPLSLCAIVSAAAESSALPWPLPRHLNTGKKTGTVSDSFAFTATGATSSTLTKAFKRYVALCLSPGNPISGGDVLEGMDVHVASDSKALGITTSENHTLTIAFPRATLTADTVYGALRGLELFSQLILKNQAIAEQIAVDWPRFPHRGTRSKQKETTSFVV